jgi:hypothetical protein
MGILYRVGYEKVACLPFAFGYYINFCIYAMLWTLQVGHEKIAQVRSIA